MVEEASQEIRALAEAFELFNKTTATLEASYRILENRVDELDAKLASKNRELRLTSDYLNYILESMSDGVIAIDTKGIVTTFNYAAASILGYEAAQVVSASFAEVFKRSFTMPPGPGAMELRSKSGAIVPVSERDAPIADREGNRIGQVKVFQDLTEIEALREQVRRMDRLAAIGEMAATVAHEIRNPLGGIRGFAALLARDIPEEDPRARLVQKILEGTKDLDVVVTDLLEYTRPVQLQYRAIPCAEIVNAALTYIELDGKDIKLERNVPGELSLFADPDKIRQVLLNILINAVQSIPASGVISIAATQNDQHVLLRVRDTGCGIEDDLVEKVFSPFFTTKEQGTGLGLAVAAKIVESHGGTLAVQSARGEGTTFTLSLPRGD